MKANEMAILVNELTLTANRLAGKAQMRQAISTLVVQALVDCEKQAIGEMVENLDTNPDCMEPCCNCITVDHVERYLRSKS